MANRREAAALELLPLAVASLARDELDELFHANASGAFFKTPPMVMYGGTPLGYAVAFSMRDTLAAILRLARSHSDKMGGLINFDDPRHACKLTGFLPLHVAVANGLCDMCAHTSAPHRVGTVRCRHPPALPDMTDRGVSRVHSGRYDFLTSLDGLPRAEQVALYRVRANQFSMARRGSARPEFCHLTPLQLATKLGDHRMFSHAMRKDAYIEWRWGPVTSYVIKLEPIDSSGSSGSDVMELIGRPDA